MGEFGDLLHFVQRKEAWDRWAVYIGSLLTVPNPSKASRLCQFISTVICQECAMRSSKIIFVSELITKYLAFYSLQQLWLSFYWKWLSVYDLSESGPALSSGSRCVVYCCFVTREALFKKCGRSRMRVIMLIKNDVKHYSGYIVFLVFWF